MRKLHMFLFVLGLYALEYVSRGTVSGGEGPRPVFLAIWPAVLMAATSLTQGLMGAAHQKAEAERQAKFQATNAAFDAQKEAEANTGQNQQTALQQLMEGYRSSFL